MLSGIGKNNHGGETMVGGRRGAFAIGRIEIVTWLWIILAIATIVVSEMHDSRIYTVGRYGKRDDSPVMQPFFFSGSRYGRSSTTNARPPKSVPRLLEVSPRVDRFFLGSRYGKRVSSNDNNNNNNSNDPQQLQSPSRMSSLRRLEEALGYIDRGQRADNVDRTNDSAYDENSSKSSSSNNNDKGNYEEIPIDIPNDDEIENYW